MEEGQIDGRLGNQFWKIRSRHGRKRLFETPELMWEAACEYFEWVEANPLIELEWKVDCGVLRQVESPKMRPFTKQGICIYLGCDTSYFRKFKSDLPSNEQELTEVQKQFVEIISMIEEIIYNQKFEGAAVGFLKESLIARDLGLVDKQNITGDFKIEQITGMRFKDGT